MVRYNCLVRTRFHVHVQLYVMSCSGSCLFPGPEWKQRRTEGRFEPRRRRVGLLLATM